MAFPIVLVAVACVVVLLIGGIAALAVYAFVREKRK